MKELVKELTYASWFAWLVHWPSVALGMLAFRLTGRTPWLAYWSMRRLYCVTRGRSNQWLARALQSPPVPEATPAGLLAPMAQRERQDQLARLRADGHAVLGRLLPQAACDALRAFAAQADCELIPPPAGGPRTARFDPAAPLAVKYALAERDAVAQPQVQALLADASLLQFARDYLGCEPVNDLVAMWWSAPGGAAASSEAAQLYHFDMDRPKFLKIFFYLSDVTPQTGPHCYIRASHRERPAPLWRDGRHADADVLRLHGADSEVEITGAAGTAIAVDTSGFHKGKPLAQGHRLILQLEYTCATFGQQCERIEVPPTPWWREQLARRPRYFARFRLQQTPTNG